MRTGKVRYLGASSMFAWQMAKYLFTQDVRHAARFVTMQNHYNLLYREEEREMNPRIRSINHLLVNGAAYRVTAQRSGSSY